MQPQEKKVNWTQFSSDEDDSWLDSDEDSEPGPQPKQQKIIPQPAVSQDKQKNTTQQQISQPKKQQVIPKRNTQQTENKRRYPSDSQILESLKKNQIEEDRKIKIIGCQNKNHLDIINKNENIIRKKQYKEHCFILQFKGKENLIQFIQEKISKNYRYKLAVFIKSNKPREERNTNKPREERNMNKPREERNRHGDNRGKQSKTDYRQKKQMYRPKHESHTHSEKREDGFLIDPKSQNQITIKSNHTHPQKLIETLKKSNVNKKFTKLYITVEARFLDYADKVVDLCAKQLDYGLNHQVKQSNYEQDPTQTIKLVLQEKKKREKIILITQQFQSKANISSYFTKCTSKNQYQIGSKHDEVPIEFNEKQYFENFKKNYAVIAKTWNTWSIQAYNKNIQTLLKLSWVFAKGLSKNAIKITVNQEQQIPIAKLFIDLKDELPKSRGKPDTSAAVNYLNA